MKKIFAFLMIICVGFTILSSTGCSNDNKNNVAQILEEGNGEPSPDAEEKKPVVDESKLMYSNFNQEDFGDLPVIRINTEDQVFPVSKEDYVNCSFAMENAGEYNFEVTMKDSPKDGDAVGIRRRGNSTYSMPKKPFRVKFNKKKSLLGLEKAKSWVLLADYIDQSSIRNYTAFSLANYFDGLGFTPNPNHVILFLNDEYMGLYLLTEQIDENAGRTDVKEDFEINDGADYPFLVEMSHDIQDGIDIFNIENYEPFEIKYPEYDERLVNGDEDPVFDYIKSYFEAVFATIYDHTKEVNFNGNIVKFSDLVDEDSFIDYILLNELMINTDNVWKSTYFYKSKDGKLIFGPIWDFDWSMSTHWTGKPYDSSYISCAQFVEILRKSQIANLYIQDPVNYSKVQERWNLAYDKLVNKDTGINKRIRDYKEEIINQARCDASYWYGETGKFQFDMQYDYVRLFLIDRIEFLNDTFNLDYSDFMELISE